MTKQKYTVLAAKDFRSLLNNGADVTTGADTLTEAKSRARYYLTTEYMNRCEVSEQLGYSQVVKGFLDEVVIDFSRNEVKA